MTGETAVATAAGSRRIVGTALVALQFVLIVALGLAAALAFMDRGASAGARANVHRSRPVAASMATTLMLGVGT